MDDSTVWALLGGAGLFATGLITEAVKSWLSAGAAQRERDEQRKTELKDRRDSFELETLLEAQDVIQRLLRQAGQVDFHTEMHFRTTGKWIRNSPELPDDVGGKGSLEAGNQLLKLMARVLDEDTRNKLSEFNSTRAGVGIRGPTMSMSDEDARAWSKSQMQALSDQFEALQAQIGARIRALYDV